MFELDEPVDSNKQGGIFGGINPLKPLCYFLTNF